MLKRHLELIFNQKSKAENTYFSSFPAPLIIFKTRNPVGTHNDDENQSRSTSSISSSAFWIKS